MSIGLLHVILFLVVVVPGQPPIQHSEPMESVEVCLTELTELIHEAAAHMEQRETASKMVQAACVLVREDQPA